jgi:hypothetical protein
MSTAATASRTQRGPELLGQTVRLGDRKRVKDRGRQVLPRTRCHEVGVSRIRCQGDDIGAAAGSRNPGNGG